MASPDDSDFVVLAETDLTDYNDAGYLPQPPEVLASIQTWLSPTKYLSENSEYRKHVNSYLEGTGHWFLQSNEYQEWHGKPSIGALWIKAVAGAGKSVLAASIAAKLADEEHVPVLFFFFRQIVALNHEPKYLIRDWLSQLLPFSPWLQRHLQKYLEKKTEIDTVSLDELWRHLCDALSFMPKAYCVVDALDEMDNDNDDFLKKLIALGQQKPASIKVLLTSRPVPHIENVLRSHILQIRVDPEDVKIDVDMYVEHRLKPVGGPPTFYETLKPIICRRAQGLFLYARLVTDELIEAVKGVSITPADIPRIVESVPETLEDVYDKMLVDHSKRSGISQEHQLTILQWVTHSTRPLRLIEAAAVMQAIGGAGETLKETKTLVRAACGPLLEVLEDETLSVIHHSFTEYLTQADRQPSQFPIITHDDAHRLMATTCVKYLCNGCLRDWNVRAPLGSDEYVYETERGSRQTDVSRELRLRHPLLEYCMSNWYIHAQKVRLDGDLLAALDKFFAADSDAMRAWLDLKVHPYPAAAFSLVHAAAWVGLPELIRHLVGLGHPADEQDNSQRTPISHAADLGHDKAVAVLVECGVNPDTDSCVGWRPIHYAAQANHHKVVKVLLGAGVDPLTGKTREHPGRRCGNSKSTVGETAVEYAATAGHTETMLELIPHLKKKDLERALHWAAMNSRSGVVAALLELTDVDVDHQAGPYSWPSTQNYGDTVVFQAVARCDPATMRLCLGKGAKTIRFPRPRTRTTMSTPLKTDQQNDEDRIPDTLMHAFAGKGGRSHWGVSDDTLREVFELIVNAGCDIDSVDDVGKTPLLYACSGRSGNSVSDLIIMMLLHAGADASKLTQDGESVFHLYSGYSVEVMNALIEHGGNVNAGAHAGNAATLSMMAQYDEEVILAFLDAQPDANVTNKRGQTALHIRATKSNRSHQVMQKLLDLGADIHATDHLGQTPLHAMAKDSLSRDPATTKFLIAAGVNLNQADHSGKTLLLLAVNQRSWKDSLGMILDLGADISVRDIIGRGICHLAIPKLEISMIKFLVERGADPQAIDNFGNTLFHEAIRQPVYGDGKRNRSIFTSLAELNVDPRQRNHNGWNALHVASGVRGSAVDITLDFAYGIDVNEADNYGVRPLHIAASLSEASVLSLLAAGADPYVRTYEGQTALHIAAKAAQSNIVGLLVQIYQENRRHDLINLQNNENRTALHEACRSGRPEMVQILLEAGADVNMLDGRNRSALHACAEALEERIFWREDSVVNGSRILDAGMCSCCYSLLRPADFRVANFMLNDPLRPLLPNRDSESQLVRVREIVRLLIAHGAKHDVAKGVYGAVSPLQFAVSKECRPMIQELLEIEARAKESHKLNKYPSWAQTPHLSRLHEGLYSHSSKQVRESLQGLERTPNAVDVLNVVQHLLQIDQDQAIPELQSLGWELSLYEARQPVVHWLAEMGYADILKCVGTEATKFDDLSLAATTEKGKTMSRGTIKPVIPVACQRELPNLPTLRVLVDDLGLDPNAQLRSEHSDETEMSAGPLHLLAAGHHWWQVGALEFLLQRNANTEIRNEKGETPLHVALNDSSYRRKYKDKIVPILLKHGANPNAVTKDGMSCLDYASASPQILQLLISHGADLNAGARPPLLSAIHSRNLETVAMLIGLGADVNQPLQQDVDTNSRNIWYDRPYNPSKLYPIYAAAVDSQSIEYTDGEDMRPKLVNLLLEKGADPYHTLDGKTTIIHQFIKDTSAAFEPFLSWTRLELEYRDPQGLTLLLKACDRASQQPSGLKKLSKMELIIRLLDRGADVFAVDDQGRGVLHYLFDTGIRGDQTPDLVTMFVTKYPKLMSMRDNEGCTPLHYTFREGPFWAARILVDAGADLTDPDPGQNTALHWIAIHSPKGPRDPLFKQSLDLGIDINARNNASHTPLASYLLSVPFAVDSDDYVISKLSSIHTAFVDNGANTFTRDEARQTLEHAIASVVDPSTEEKYEWLTSILSTIQTCFVDNGAENFTRDEAGQTLEHAMAFAVESGKKQDRYLASILSTIQTVFVDNGADIFTRDEAGQTLLHALAKRNPGSVYGCSLEELGKNIQGIFQDFVARGLDPWMEDKGQMTSLDVAAVVGNEHILGLFRKGK
jgi:ankyrin repeat protein